MTGPIRKLVLGVLAAIAVTIPVAAIALPEQADGA